jgi:leucyl-tRNA synthetase
MVAKDMPAAEVIALAKAEDAVAAAIDGKTIVKEICVPNKIVNIVVR